MPGPARGGARQRDGDTSLQPDREAHDGTRLPDQPETCTACAYVPAWSWDGKTIAFLIGSQDLLTLNLISLDSADGIKPVIAEPRFMLGVAWGPR